jgi:transposase
MNNLAEAYCGVDVSKAHLDIYIYPNGKSFKIENSKTDIDKFAREYLAGQNVKRITCEATGGYEGLLKSTFKEHGHNVWIVDPKRIKAFRVASGLKSKSDKIDAKMIAEFSVKNAPDYETVGKTENQNMLHALNARKKDLTNMLAEEKTRLQHPVHQASKTSIQRLLKVFEKEIKSLEQQIKDLVKQDNDLNKKAELLESIPGIGFATAALLISSVPELGTLDKKEIAALIGVCPFDNSSGTFNGKRFIRGGRMEPRNALYMCALTTIKYHLPLKTFYDRLIAAGKMFKVAIVAVMRKLIIIANTILKRGEPCRP